MKENIILSLVSIFVVSLFAEAGLSYLNYPEIKIVSRVEILPSWRCDEGGCRNDRSKMKPSENKEGINAQGYRDRDDFIDSPMFEDSLRFLVLGDSFTWGASADEGRSWVDLLERRLADNRRVVFWNTAMPGTGTEHALKSAKRYLPVMKPHFVLLGFYVGNDFDDNLFPIDRYFKAGDGRLIEQYQLDVDFNPIKLPKETAYSLATGARVIDVDNTIERIMDRSHLGMLVTNGISRLPYLFRKTVHIFKGIEEIKYKKTFDYLTALNELVLTNGSRLVVLIIPLDQDVKHQSKDYHDIKRILAELSIDYVDALPVLREGSYKPPSDRHWNNEGHSAAGGLMADALLPLLDTPRRPVSSDN